LLRDILGVDSAGRSEVGVAIHRIDKSLVQLRECGLVPTDGTTDQRNDMRIIWQ
jgi:hypothetical protein